MPKLPTPAPLLPALGRRRVYVSLNPRLTDSPLRRSLYDNGTRPAPTPGSPTREATTP